MTQPSWKQPIPTDLESEFGDDKQAFVLFVLLLLKAANDLQTVKLGKKLIELKRGQTIFGRNKFAEYFGFSPHTCERILKRLQKAYNKVSISPIKGNYTIVAIENYDSLTTFEQPLSNKVSNRRASGEHTQEAKNKEAAASNAESHIFGLGEFTEKFGKQSDASIPSALWKDAVSRTYKRYTSGYPGKDWSKLIILKAKDLAGNKQALSVADKEPDVAHVRSWDELAVGDWKMPDGTWRLVREIGGKRTHEQVSEAEYLKRDDSGEK